MFLLNVSHLLLYSRTLLLSYCFFLSNEFITATFFSLLTPHPLPHPLSYVRSFFLFFAFRHALYLSLNIGKMVCLFVDANKRRIKLISTLKNVYTVHCFYGVCFFSKVWVFGYMFVYMYMRAYVWIPNINKISFLVCLSLIRNEMNNAVPLPLIINWTMFSCVTHLNSNYE